MSHPVWAHVCALAYRRQIFAILLACVAGRAFAGSPATAPPATALELDPCRWRLEQVIPLSYAGAPDRGDSPLHAFFNMPEREPRWIALDWRQADAEGDAAFVELCRALAPDAGRAWCSAYHAQVLSLKRGDGVRIVTTDGERKFRLRRFLGRRGGTLRWLITSAETKDHPSVLHLPFFTARRPFDRGDIRDAIRHAPAFLAQLPRGVAGARVVDAGPAHEYLRLEWLGDDNDGQTFLDRDYATLRSFFYSFVPWPAMPASRRAIFEKESALRMQTDIYWQWLDARQGVRRPQPYDFDRAEVWARYREDARGFRFVDGGWKRTEWE